MSGKIEAIVIVRLLELNKQWIIRSCYQLKNMLRLITFQKHEYFILTDGDNKDAIIYSNGFNSYLPICENVRILDVVDPTTFCYASLTIKFNFRNKSKQAFSLVIIL